LVSDSLVAVWIKTIALLRTLRESEKTLRPIFKILKRLIKNDKIRQEAKKAAETYSTFSYGELKEISRRLDDCKNHYMLGPSGKERNRCICEFSMMLRKQMGENYQEIDEWQRIYDQLDCASYET